MERMKSDGIDVYNLFGQSNIHPKNKFLKNENIRFAEKIRNPFIDLDYDVQNWFARAKGLKMSQNRECVVQNVLICVLKEPRFMLTKIIFQL